MNCEEAINLMDGYLDGELDPVTNQEIERHLRNCGKCEQAYEAQRALVRAIGSSALYYKAPQELRDRIRSSLRNEIGAKATRNGTQGSQVLQGQKKPEQRSILSEMPWNWLALAAAIILAAIIASRWGRLAGPGWTLWWERRAWANPGCSTSLCEPCRTS